MYIYVYILATQWWRDCLGADMLTLPLGNKMLHLQLRLIQESIYKIWIGTRGIVELMAIEAGMCAHTEELC